MKIFREHFEKNYENKFSSHKNICARNIFNILRNFSFYTTLLSEYLKYLSYIF